jgi:DNA primase
MTQRISKSDLHTLRNDIPVNDVIKNMLALPTKMTDGFFRFLCPLCSDFHTAINPKTNLARCFRCQENFNSIDLVMRVKNVNFKEAVSMLSSHLKLLSQRPPPVRTLPARPPAVAPANLNAHRHPSGDLSSVREILECALGYSAKRQSS